MDKQGKIILVTGATGNQGGATARHLHANGWSVRALTRNTESPTARTLANAGIEVVQGDLNDRASIDRALDGVYGVFSVQNFWTEGAEGEIRQGKTLADAAKAAGVKHFVFTSVGGAERNTGIVHFDSKWEIEKHIAALELPATILRPVFFMENFRGFFPLVDVNGVLTLTMAMHPETKLQLIAVDDIGALAAIAFDRPEEFIGRGIEIAGDSLTLPEVAETLSRAWSTPVQFVEQPIEQVRAFSEEMAIMFDWFNASGYNADLDSLRAIHPGLLTFEAWVAKSGWTRPAPVVQTESASAES